MQTYKFTREQLTKVLNEAIGLFVEYRDQYGYEEATAQPRGVSEVLAGLDAERDLLDHGDIDAATLQTIDEAAPLTDEDAEETRIWFHRMTKFDVLTMDADQIEPIREQLPRVVALLDQRVARTEDTDL